MRGTPKSISAPFGISARSAFSISLIIEFNLRRDIYRSGAKLLTINKEWT
jgi:hypothetical protein